MTHDGQWLSLSILFPTPGYIVSHLPSAHFPLLIPCLSFQPLDGLKCHFDNHTSRAPLFPSQHIYIFSCQPEQNDLFPLQILNSRRRIQSVFVTLIHQLLEDCNMTMIFCWIEVTIKRHQISKMKCNWRDFKKETSSFNFSFQSRVWKSNADC